MHFCNIQKDATFFSVDKLKSSFNMDLMPKENYSKVSSDDSEEDARSSTFDIDLDIDIERAKESPKLSNDKSPRKVFIRRPAMNQVK